MSATTTAGEVPPTAREASLPPTAAAEGSEAEEAPPPGRLICRTKSATEGTSELYLDWDGPTAKGFVRRVAPSGMIYVERVRAERDKDAIIVDEPSSVDLVTHAAVVGRQDGKQYMRVGDQHQPWVPCE